MASWFDALLNDFRDLPERTVADLSNIREIDRVSVLWNFPGITVLNCFHFCLCIYFRCCFLQSVRDTGLELNKREEELLEFLKDAIKNVSFIYNRNWLNVV